MDDNRLLDDDYASALYFFIEMVQQKGYSVRGEHIAGFMERIKENPNVEDVACACLAQ